MPYLSINNNFDQWEYNDGMNNTNTDHEELKEKNPELYKVAFEKGTEAPFVGKHVNEKGNGMYHCAVCGTELFSSNTKFDSGSGWPSFTDPADREAVTLVPDDTLGMRRTEVLCKKCGAHLGHVFPDGPVKASGGVCNRYCINSISLDFKKEE
jgi:peptide-methionine (R)-S-oxide reductase